MKSVLVFDNSPVVECFKCGVRVTVSINKPIEIVTSTACPLCGNVFQPSQWTVENS